MELCLDTVYAMHNAREKTRNMGVSMIMFCKEVCID